MTSAKMVTPGLLKITILWNKGYDVMICVNDVTNKVLWHDSNYTVDAFMWPNFGNFRISMRKVITMKLETLHQCGKRVKTKSQKVLEPNSDICRSYRESTGRWGAFWPHLPSWIGLTWTRGADIKVAYISKREQTGI